jgi:hypothetical protein
MTMALQNTASMSSFSLPLKKYGKTSWYFQTICNIVCDVITGEAQDMKQRNNK